MKKSQKDKALDIESPVVVQEKIPEDNVKKAPKEDDVPQHICDIMKLYPHMESLYIGKGGFVYVEGTPKAMRGDAKLYKNKYFKK